MTRAGLATQEAPARPLTIEGERFLADVIVGLSAEPKTLPCKYFYDEIGAELFDLITTTSEYYPTRVETALLCRHLGEIRELAGEGVDVVELGGASEHKARLLLSGLDAPRRYVPVDVARKPLAAASRRVARAFPNVIVRPYVCDFAAPRRLPKGLEDAQRVLLFFPGSTIGNFAPAQATRLLTQWRAITPAPVDLLIGVDVVKDRATMEAAYNDETGYTAAFNRNILEHANRALGTSFDPDAFMHEAFFNERESCIEMHLRSRKAQRVRVGEQMFAFAPGESIRTERSFKYTPESFAAIVDAAGFTAERSWVDEDGLFSLHYLRSGGAAPARASAPEVEEETSATEATRRLDDDARRALRLLARAHRRSRSTPAPWLLPRVAGQSNTTVFFA